MRGLINWSALPGPKYQKSTIWLYGSYCKSSFLWTLSPPSVKLLWKLALIGLFFGRVGRKTETPQLPSSHFQVDLSETRIHHAGRSLHCHSPCGEGKTPGHMALHLVSFINTKATQIFYLEPRRKRAQPKSPLTQIPLCFLL